MRDHIIENVLLQWKS